MLDIRVCVPCRNTLGEGPLWDVDQERLYWIDGLGQEIWRAAPDGSDLRTWTLPAVIGSMALRAQGGAILALETGLHLFDFETGALDLIAHPEEGLPGVRLNDGKVDCKGRFIVGSLDMEALAPAALAPPRGSLYRLDTDLSLQRLDTGICIANGPCWSPDQRTFYFTDSALDTIFAYDWDVQTGTPHHKRTFATLPPRCIPDGGTVDSQGYVWTAANGAFSGIGELRRYAPDGTLERKISLPVPKPTSLMFGGADLDILFVTTMNIEGEIPSTPQDGSLFAIHGLGISGLPERRFGG